MDRSKRTGGEWIGVFGFEYAGVETADRSSVVCEFNDPLDDEATVRADMETIRLAGTTANKLDALGYDGDACIEALPEIVAALAKVYETRRQWREDDRYSSIDYMDAMDAIPMEGIFTKVRPAKEGGVE